MLIYDNKQVIKQNDIKINKIVYFEEFLKIIISLLKR